jgi:biotin carboxyl carrier protein
MAVYQVTVGGKEYRVEIEDVNAQPGDQVEVGQDPCVLDAMKMNNRIRAPRAGTVAQVHVSPSQQVQYGDLLVTFTDEGQ